MLLTKIFSFTCFKWGKNLLKNFYVKEWSPDLFLPFLKG